MANRLYTTFQNMSKVFSGSWGAGTGIANTEEPKVSDEVIYTTTNPDEYKSKMLELQQNKYLQNRWLRVNQNLSMSAFAGLSNVKLMYRDADLMDSYPEIGAALDIIAEESVVTAGSKTGQVVNVSSKSDRIKSILEDLFVNRLNLQITAPMVIRAMCKYGNQFMLLDIDKNLGVKGWRQLPVGEVERVENGIISPYGGASVIGIETGDISDKDMSTKFIWTNEMGSGAIMPFKNWQIAHFRLLHNSMYLPYGVSALSAARRHFRMLALMEDMMLIYRLERSMERRVYKIYVGALDDEDIPAFVEKIADQFKRTPIVDPLTGQLDLRKNILPVWKKTPIPLKDGRTITIEELAREYEEGKENKVYSIQKGTGKVVDGYVMWCGKTGTPDELLKVVFYNGTHMVMAAEHEVMMIDGKMKCADKLKPGDMVMPFDNELKSNDVSAYPNPSIHFTVKEVERIEGDDVYCMTVQGYGKTEKDDRHNFALLTFNEDGTWNEAGGCFVSNCASDDIFIPVRDPAAPTPIETLAGAKNLEAIDDIKYIQNKVCAALRIPKSFLNFEEVQGDGKNLALMDVRFARTINRYQQAFLMELTKIATIHLFILGFEDDLTNFNLTMNNPSSQAEMLELENMSKKVSIFRDAVSDPGNGLPAMSWQTALKMIFKYSDAEIKDLLGQIRLERGLSAELEKTAEIIKRTGLFDMVDRIYGEPGAEYSEGEPGGGGEGPGGGPMGGGGGFGGGIDDFGSPTAPEGMEVSGNESEEPTEEMGNGGATGEANGESGPKMESKRSNRGSRKRQGVINEAKSSGNKLMIGKIFSDYVNGIGKKKVEEPNRTSIYDKNLLFNEEVDDMLKMVNDFKEQTE